MVTPVYFNTFDFKIMFPRRQRVAINEIMIQGWLEASLK